VSGTRRRGCNRARAVASSTSPVPTFFRPVLLLASALALGCDAPSEPDAAPAPPAPSRSAEVPAESEPADAAPADAAPADAAPEGAPADAARDAAAVEPISDAALFAMRDKGLVVLTDEGFSTVEGSDRLSVQQLARGPDGRVFFLGSGDIQELSGTTLRLAQKIDYDAHGSVRTFAPDRAGGFWLTSSNGAVHIEAGGTTTTEPKSTFGDDVLFAGVAVDETDQPWVATSHALFTRAAGSWASVPRPKGGMSPPYFEEVEPAPDGAVFVRGADVVLRIDSADSIARVKVGGGSFPILGDMAFSDNGMGVIRTDIEAVSVVQPDAARTRYRSPKDFKIGNVRAVGADDQGRVWVTGDAGIAILGPGDARVTWRSGSQEPVAGEIDGLLVLGRGPALPDAGEVKRGGLAGRVMKDGAGVAGVTIELCESPSFIYSRTPCTGAATHLKGKTDAEGKWSFDGVPLGAYGIAVKVGRKWQVTMGSALGTKMKAGETYDIGDIALQAAK
jgi:streptogramin lyase